MRNPTYAGDFQASPMPERVISINLNEPHETRPALSVGIKTITHNRDGMKLCPHKVIAIEIVEGDEVSSFDLPPSMARMYAARLAEYADAVDGAKAA